MTSLLNPKEGNWIYQIKIPVKNQLQKKSLGFILSQECEAAGHSVSIDRKQRELYAAAHLTSSFLISTEFHHQKWYLPCLR